MNMSKDKQREAMKKAIAWKQRHDYTYCVVFGNGKTVDSLFREFNQLTVAIGFTSFCRDIGLKAELIKQGV
jgi:hypothetical protein